MDSPKQMETEFEFVDVKIESRVSFKSPLNANTVEIHIEREKEEFFEYELDGSYSKIGSSIKATPFPIPIIILNNLVSFESHYINDLLYDKVDFFLRYFLTEAINSEAGNKVRPLYVFIRVKLTPQRLYGGGEEEKETCAICLEEISFDSMAKSSSRLSCSHEFHNDCLGEWIIRKNTTCPLCRTVIEDE